jgi:hypothetical protein
MMTLLAVVTVCALLALLYLRLRHSHAGLVPASRPDARAGALAYPAALPPPTLSCRVSAACPAFPAETDWRAISGLTKTEAEDLLDWLEGQGVRERALGELAAGGFTVRYK